MAQAEIDTSESLTLDKAKGYPQNIPGDKVNERRLRLSDHCGRQPELEASQLIHSSVSETEENKSDTLTALSWYRVWIPKSVQNGSRLNQRAFMPLGPMHELAFF